MKRSVRCCEFHHSPPYGRGQGVGLHLILRQVRAASEDLFLFCMCPLEFRGHKKMLTSAQGSFEMKVCGWNSPCLVAESRSRSTLGKLYISRVGGAKMNFL